MSPMTTACFEPMAEAAHSTVCCPNLSRSISTTGHARSSPRRALVPGGRGGWHGVLHQLPGLADAPRCHPPGGHRLTGGAALATQVADHMGGYLRGGHAVPTTLCDRRWAGARVQRARVMSRVIGNRVCGLPSMFRPPSWPMRRTSSRHHAGNQGSLALQVRHNA